MDKVIQLVTLLETVFPVEEYYTYMVTTVQDQTTHDTLLDVSVWYEHTSTSYAVISFRFDRKDNLVKEMIHTDNAANHNKIQTARVLVVSEF